jgi:signal peptidase I
VNKLAYDLKVPFTTWHLAEWGAPQRGDIAVFYSPYDGKRLVKRVVGLPGDQLEMRDNRLLLNGEPLAYAPLPFESLRGVSANDLERYRYLSEDLDGRPHAVASQPSLTAPRTWGPFTVPDGQYFMMGDNRDESFDSRYWGFVPRKQILGRASSVVISLDRSNGWAPRWERFFTGMGS